MTNDIELYYTLVSQNDSKYLLEKLDRFPENIRHRIGRYRNQQDRLARICAMVMLDKIVHGAYPEIPSPLDLLRRDENNKPCMAGIGLNFSISHSGDVVVVAISDFHKIGVDVAFHQPIEMGILSDLFHEKEWQRLEKYQFASSLFYKMWTIKEAVSKVLGLGINARWKEMNTLQNPVKYKHVSFHTRTIPLFNDYTVTVAGKNPTAEITVVNMWL